MMEKQLLSLEMLKYLRLAIVFILKQCPGDCITWFGLKCSSLCGMNRGTSERCASDAMGNTSRPSVAQSNTMIERTSVVICCDCKVIAGKGSFFSTSFTHLDLFCLVNLFLNPLV